MNSIKTVHSWTADHHAWALKSVFAGEFDIKKHFSLWHWDCDFGCQAQIFQI